MSASQSEPDSKRIYRYKPYYFTVNFIQAAAAIVLGCALIWEQSKKDHLHGSVSDGIIGIGLFFVAALLVLEALNSSVIFDQCTISVRHFWGTSSRMKDEILGVKTTWRFGIAYTVLLPKRSTDKELEIERSAYLFDEDWVGWISSLPDFDRAQMLEVHSA